MDALIKARLRKIFDGLDLGSEGDEETLVADGQRNLLIAMGNAPYLDINRIGRSFKLVTATAVASAAAIPTTTGGLSIYNNEPDNGRSYIIDFISATGIATAAAAGHAQLLALVGQVREAIPTDSGLVPTKMNGLGGGNVDTRARSILTGTALPATTGVANNWFPVGPGIERTVATSVPGAGLFWAAEGRIIVPPGRYFSACVLADTAASTFQICIAWHEKLLKLG